MIERPCKQQFDCECENRPHAPHPTRKSRNGYSPLRFTVWGNSGSLHSRATNLPFLVQQDWLRKSSIKEVESVAFQDLVLVYHPVHYNPRAIFIFGAERKTIRIHPAQRSGGHPPSLPPSLLLVVRSSLICFQLSAIILNKLSAEKNPFATTM